MLNRKKIGQAAVSAAAICWASQLSFAAPTWNGTTSGDWNTPANWTSPAAVPTSADSAVFNSAAGTKTVTFSAGTSFATAPTASSNTVTKVTFNGVGYTLGTNAGFALEIGATGSVLVNGAAATGSAALGVLTNTIAAPVVFGPPAGTNGATSFTITNSADDFSSLVFSGPITTVANATGVVSTISFSTSGSSATGTTITISGVVQDSPAGYGFAGKTNLRKGGGAGFLLLTGANTYTGGTNIAAIANSGIRLSGAGTLGATNGSLSMGAGALLDLNGTSQSIGAIADVAATSATSIYNNGSGTSTFSIGNGDTSNVTGFQGTIADRTGAGTGIVALTKNGTGTQILIGNNTYTGATTINNGSLIIGTAAVTSASLGNTPVRVGTTTTGQGILGGTGTIGGLVSVDTGGTIAPGAGSNVTGGSLTSGFIATFKINNSLGRFGTDAFGTLSMDVNDNAGTITNDLISGLTATPNFTGGTLALNLTGTFVGGESFDILDWTGGAITGQFASITGAPVGFTFDTSALYTTGVVSLTAAAAPEPASIAVVGLASLALLRRCRRAI